MLIIKPDPLNILDTNLDDTNKQKLLNDNLNDIAEYDGDLTITVDLTNLPTFISLFKIYGKQVILTFKDKTTNKILKQNTYPLDNNGLFTLWDYFYSLFNNYKDKLITPLPIYLNSVLEIKIINIAGKSKLGVIVLGRDFNIGQADYTANINMLNTSILTTTTNGVNENIETLKDFIETTVYLDYQKLVFVKDYFRQIFNKKVIWLFSLTDTAKQVYGIYKSFEPVYVVNGKVKLNLQIQCIE